MQKLETPLKDLYVLQLKRLRDSRGWFSESYSKLRFEELGFVHDFVQDNHSKSVKNVVRGLHFQKITNPYYGQAKLVRCTKGKVWDVVVDIRKDSTTYKQWFGIELTEDNNKMLMVPVGFAHGFSVLSDEAEVQYKCTSPYLPDLEQGFRYDDEEVNVDWKVEEPLVSERDLEAKTMKELRL